MGACSYYEASWTRLRSSPNGNFEFRVCMSNAEQDLLAGGKDRHITLLRVSAHSPLRVVRFLHQRRRLIIALIAVAVHDAARAVGMVKQSGSTAAVRAAGESPSTGVGFQPKPITGIKTKKAGSAFGGKARQAKPYAAATDGGEEVKVQNLKNSFSLPFVGVEVTEKDKGKDQDEVEGAVGSKEDDGEVPVPTSGSDVRALMNSMIASGPQEIHVDGQAHEDDDGNPIPSQEVALLGSMVPGKDVGLECMEQVPMSLTQIRAQNRKRKNGVVYDGPSSSSSGDEDDDDDDDEEETLNSGNGSGIFGRPSMSKTLQQEKAAKAAAAATAAAKKPKSGRSAPDVVPFDYNAAADKPGSFQKQIKFQKEMTLKAQQAEEDGKAMGGRGGRGGKDGGRGGRGGRDGGRGGRGAGRPRPAAFSPFASADAPGEIKAATTRLWYNYLVMGLEVYTRGRHALGYAGA
eukprot:gene17511-23825_t